MELITLLKFTISKIISNIGWSFSMVIVIGAIIMFIIDYRNGKFK